jgi:hypothetical protein
MGATTRRAVGVLTALVLTVPGLVAGAGPASAGVGTITGSTGDVQVTAELRVPDDQPTESLSVWMAQNGSAIDLTSAMVTVTRLSGEVVYARETSFELRSSHWIATDFDLPAGVGLGRYLLSFDATVSVQTDAGPVDVRLAGTDVLTFSKRTGTYIRDLQATPQNMPVGQESVVTGIAVSTGGRPLTGESVRIWFDPAGAMPRIYRGAAKVDDRGYVQRTLSVPSDGTWQAQVVPSDTVRASGVYQTAQDSRKVAGAAHSGIAMRSTNGYAGGIRLSTADVVVGLEPVTARIDAGVVGFGWARSGPTMWVDSRRSEGRYPDGVQLWPDLWWGDDRAIDHGQASYTTVRISPLMPAGVYDIGVTGETIAVCTEPEPERRQNCIDDEVTINDRTITTMTVKRASSIAVKASQTAMTDGKTITVGGVLRRVQLVGTTGVANPRVPDAAVKLYFDPAGSAGPVYRKTVRTNADGAYSTRVWTGGSGRWVAKYPGTSLHAPSQATVAVTVG